MTTWTLVSERLPKKSGMYTVIVYTGKISRYVFKNGESNDTWKRCVVAWSCSKKPYEEQLRIQEMIHSWKAAKSEEQGR